MMVILVLGVVYPQMSSQRAASQQVTTPNRVLARQAAILTGQVPSRPKEMAVSGGVMTAYMERLAAQSSRAQARTPAPAPAGPKKNTLGCSNTFNGSYRNVRVNQDCSLRRQAEEWVAINPLDPNNVVAGQNDSRIGFNHCGIDYSFNRGRKWGDMVPPFWQFIMADGHTADACSDPTGAFDADGNVYFSGILFDVAAAASAIVVAKSNATFGGSTFHSPANVLFQQYSSVPLGVIASDNNPDIFNDKQLMAADANPASPKRSFLYMTWTRFNFATGAGVGANSPIYFSQSSDGGATWSPGVEISGANPAICTAFSGSASPNACDQDQGSMPFVGPDGTVYVVFGNGNTPVAGMNQVLLVKCLPGFPCTSAASWSAPTKVGDLVGIHPFGPSAAGCPAGRQCLPPNGYRVPEFTSISGSVHPGSKHRVLVTWADARNLGVNCNPLGDANTAIPPCDNDAFLAYSDDGGATWSAAINVSDKTGNDNQSAQWQPWSTTGPTGKFYFVYYDRRYGTCEITGCNDITLAVSNNAGTAANPSFTFHRITTASMPNLTLANNPVQAGFLGDYMYIAADKYGAVIVWADTRPLPGFTAPEEDIYMARFPN
jgi:hypothetical protein